MTMISGYAFRKGEVEAAMAINARYRALSHIQFPNLRTESEFNKCIYRGDLPDEPMFNELSDEDIAVICDRGCVCFGAEVLRKARSFECTIYTD